MVKLSFKMFNLKLATIALITIIDELFLWVLKKFAVKRLISSSLSLLMLLNS